ncbi:helix-turn-helix domain-containing protein [Actinomadura barringtoniae]|uniref:Helix-turn-helix domain-containing protein n=1 Tax=Actinomadura barringtoniae TaxID=1427535 RepID=A0A939PKD1_9ACTN|nr:helix-turn-helix transcriptional regulator [Actinomadura barringtoniae]MBO2451454.1 helix-turn-helix domain-containing protein [Actinomadura barringtoniae]
MGSAIPSVRWRRIGSALRSLREARGLTISTVARRYGRSTGWFSTLENGLHTIDTWELTDLLDFYEVPTDDPLHESLVYLSARGRGGRWQRPWEGRVSAAALDLLSLEQDTNLIRDFHASIIPGLLQDEPYVKALMEGGLDSPGRDNDALVSFRLERQKILAKAEAPRYEAVIGESALRQHIGGVSVLRAQLRSLSDKIQAPHTSIRVLPHTASIDLGLSAPFHMLQLRPPGRLTVVLADAYTQGTFIESESDVARFNRIFDHLRRATLDESASLEFVEGILSGA